MQRDEDSLSAEDQARGRAAARSWAGEVRDALRGQQHDYTSGSLGRAITLLAIPMVLEMAMESLFAICDVFFVARLGDDAVAAVGLTEAMLTVVYALAYGLSTATTALVARRIGEKNPDGAVRAATQAIALGLAVGVLLGAPCLLSPARLLELMGAHPGVVATGEAYTGILLGSNAIIMLLFLNNAIFRGAGDAVLAMRTLWLANGVNLVLDPCLIFGLGPFPEMGLTGAAVATVCGRGAGVLYQCWALRRGVGRVVLRGSAFRLQPGVMLELLRLSFGGVTQSLIATASWIALMRIVSPYGEEALAGYTIAIRIVVFALLPSWGLCNAAATLVGQNLGAGRPERAERSVWLTGLFNTAFLGLVTVFFLVLAPWLIRFFTDNEPTERFGVAALRIMSTGYVFYAWGMVMVQAFNGAGDTMTPTKLNFVCYWLCQIPLAWVLAHGAGMGPSGVFWSVAIAESLLAVASILLFRRGRWKSVRLAPDEK